MIHWIRNKLAERRQRIEDQIREETHRQAEEAHEAHIRKCLTKENPQTFRFGGGWGCHVSWFGNPEDRKVYGHHYSRPNLGDVCKIPMESGKIMIARFIKVKWCPDPPDMFFGTLHFVGYEDTSCDHPGCSGQARHAYMQQWPGGKETPVYYCTEHDSYKGRDNR